MSIYEGSPIPIKELLIEATFAPNRAIRNGVTQIDLGSLGTESERISDRGLEDNVEYGMIAMVTEDRKLLLSKNERRGESTVVVHRIEIESYSDFKVPKHLRQNRFVGALIHNHPIDSPPSTQDLIGIFLEDRDPFAQTAVFVASPKWKIVIFRGENTPEWNKDECDLNRNTWLEINQQLLNGSITPEMDVNTISYVEKIAQRVFLRQLALTQDIRIYKCPLRQNIATLEDMSEPLKSYINRYNQ